MEIRDRAKDFIIPRGESIATIEIEDILSARSAVQAAMVVARLDAFRGETPCAIIEPNPEEIATAAELTAHNGSARARF